MKRDKEILSILKEALIWISKNFANCWTSYIVKSKTPKVSKIATVSSSAIWQGI
jgi:hypothetical protein